MNLVRKLRANCESPRDLWLLCQVVMLATVVPCMLRLLPLSTVMRALAGDVRAERASIRTDHCEQKIAKYLDAVLRCNFWIYRPNCLRRALILCRLLRDHGFDVQIQFGVRFDAGPGKDQGPGRMDGHAWLVYQGEGLLERHDHVLQAYQVTYRFPE